MIQLSENQIKDIKRLVGYRGRKVYIKPFRPGMSLNSYWDSGSRDYFWYISVYNELLPRVVQTIPQNGTPFDKLSLRADKLDSHVVLVRKWVCRGKDASITIYVDKL